MVINHYLKIIYALTAGLLFAFLQTGYFFQLELLMTAAYPSYLALTLAWLLGSVVGLRLAKEFTASSRLHWLLTSLIAYALSLCFLRLFPYQMAWLPLHGFCIAVSGMQSGNFFAINRSLFDSSSSLFFWENNGFVAGWIAGFFGFAWFGCSFHWLAPICVGIILALVGRIVSTVENKTRQLEETSLIEERL